jgi:excisionase family DNA binding protein
MPEPSTKPQPVQLLNVDEVAKRLGVSVGTVLLLVQDGLLPSPISSKPRRWLLSDALRLRQQARLPDLLSVGP